MTHEKRDRAAWYARLRSAAIGISCTQAEPARRDCLYGTWRLERLGSRAETLANDSSVGLPSVSTV